MQWSFRLDKRPGESHLALDGKKEREVGLVPGLDTNGLSWIRTFQRRLQLLAEEGEMSSLLEGSVAPEF